MMLEKSAICSAEEVLDSAYPYLVLKIMLRTGAWVR